MDSRALASLILRISGLIVIVTTLAFAAKNFGPLMNPEMVAKLGLASILLAAAVSIAVPLLLGVALVYFPSTAGDLFKIPVAAPAESDIAPLQRVAFSAIGLWFAVTAVIDAVYVYSKVRLYHRMVADMPSYGPAPAILPDDFATLVSAAVELVVGLWLLFGSRGLTRMLERLRGARASG